MKDAGAGLLFIDLGKKRIVRFIYIVAAVPPRT